jgi:putative FmdB family regulatory protein
MPTYDYKCPLCHQSKAIVRSIHEDDPGYECANCKVPMHQMIGGVALKFNGGGWGKDA